SDGSFAPQTTSPGAPTMTERMHRRDFLQSATAGVLALTGRTTAQERAGKQIAAIVTEFRPNSHAEVLAGRWLEGFELNGEAPGPQSKIVALYTDQVPANDISRKLAEKHKVPIYDTIRETLCRGGAKLAVDGVLIIGEHGKYPSNDKEQHLY